MPIARTTRRSLTVGLLASLLLAAACTMIPPRPGADKVVVAEEGNVAACESKGTTTSSVVASVGVFARLPEVVADDLARVAANSAIDMGGDTIVPLGPVADGKRKFGIYKCRRDEPPPSPATGALPKTY